MQNPQDKNSAGPNIYINGRGQIIELLQALTATERDNLLRNIKQKNPTLANELRMESLSFEDIQKLGDVEVRALLKGVKPAITGIALKTSGSNLQRKILSLVDRNYAEEAYRYMITPTANEARDSKRAQKKILEVAVSHLRNKF